MFRDYSPAKQEVTMSNVTTKKADYTAKPIGGPVMTDEQNGQASATKGSAYLSQEPEMAHLGSTQDPPTEQFAVVTPAPITVAVETLLCRHKHCGADNKLDAKFCRACGDLLVPEPVTAKSALMSSFDSKVSLDTTPGMPARNTDSIQPTVTIENLADTLEATLSGAVKSKPESLLDSQTGTDLSDPEIIKDDDRKDKHTENIGRPLHADDTLESVSEETNTNTSLAKILQEVKEHVAATDSVDENPETQAELASIDESLQADATLKSVSEEFNEGEVSEQETLDLISDDTQPLLEVQALKPDTGPSLANLFKKLEEHAVVTDPVSNVADQDEVDDKTLDRSETEKLTESILTELEEDLHHPDTRSEEEKEEAEKRHKQAEEIKKKASATMRMTPNNLKTTSHYQTQRPVDGIIFVNPAKEFSPPLGFASISSHSRQLATPLPTTSFEIPIDVDEEELSEPPIQITNPDIPITASVTVEEPINSDEERPTLEVLIRQHPGLSADADEEDSVKHEFTFRESHVVPQPEYFNQPSEVFTEDDDDLFQTQRFSRVWIGIGLVALLLLIGLPVLYYTDFISNDDTKDSTTETLLTASLNSLPKEEKKAPVSKVEVNSPKTVLTTKTTPETEREITEITTPTETPIKVENSPEDLKEIKELSCQNWDPIKNKNRIYFDPKTKHRVFKCSNDRLYLSKNRQSINGKTQLQIVPFKAH